MTMQETKAPEGIFVPIDLEASLGKIEGENDAMDCDEPCQPSNGAPKRRLTRTRSRALPGSKISDDRAVTISPCRSKDSPPSDENMMVTDDMGDDTKVVSEVPTDLEKVSDWRKSFDLDLVPNDKDQQTECDDFSLTSQEADSMVGEELEEDLTENLDSFWESGTAVPPSSSTAATSTGSPTAEPTRISISSLPDVRTM